VPEEKELDSHANSPVKCGDKLEPPVLNGIVGETVEDASCLYRSVSP
jgi:hypothetical protein